MISILYNKEESVYLYPYGAHCWVQKACANRFWELTPIRYWWSTHLSAFIINISLCILKGSRILIIVYKNTTNVLYRAFWIVGVCFVTLHIALNRGWIKECLCDASIVKCWEYWMARLAAPTSFSLWNIINGSILKAIILTSNEAYNESVKTVCENTCQNFPSVMWQAKNTETITIVCIFAFCGKNILQKCWKTLRFLLTYVFLFSII